MKYQLRRWAKSVCCRRCDKSFADGEVRTSFLSCNAVKRPNCSFNRLSSPQTCAYIAFNTCVLLHECVFSAAVLVFWTCATSRTRRPTSCWAPWWLPWWRMSGCHLTSWETFVWVRHLPHLLSSQLYLNSLFRHLCDTTPRVLGSETSWGNESQRKQEVDVCPEQTNTVKLQRDEERPNLLEDQDPDVLALSPREFNISFTSSQSVEILLWWNGGSS